MKSVLFICLYFCALLSTASTSEQSVLLESSSSETSSQLVKATIVGGELAAEDDWPWVAALVYTYNDISSSLAVAGKSYDSEPFLYGALGRASATMVDCGIGDYQCDLAAEKICLIARGTIDFSTKIDNCQAGGGIGAIIYNNVVGSIGGTLGTDYSGAIPTVGISMSDGNKLLLLKDFIATIDITSPKSAIQSVNCGASFIGKQWVVTAAHCVDGAQVDLLQVNVGAYDLTNSDDPIAIKRIYIHPDYSSGTDGNSDLDNDIALIELAQSIDQPAITLLDEDETRKLALSNTVATVIGWGNTIAYSAGSSVSVSSQPDKLLQVDLPLLSNEQCKDTLVEAYQTLYNTTYSPEQVGITNNMICAHDSSGGKGSCQGDSGGPLVVNTSQGWQQVGIVSHGIGCGDESFPDVYTRVSKFTDWINNITQGVEFDSDYDFSITPQYQSQTKLLGITNHSDFTANLTFTLVADNLDSNGFSFSTNNCKTLLSKESCLIQVTFDAESIGHQSATISLDTDDTNIATSEVNITAQAVALDTSIAEQLVSNIPDSLWFSGGDQPWQSAATGNATFSGDLTDNQQSSVLLTFTGEGSLTFDWAVSSEANEQNENSPFDALYLIVDGEVIDFISGEVPYTQMSIDNLTAGDHQILWLYKKDNFVSSGEDRAYLKNIVFTAQNSLSDSNESASSSSSGGVFFGYLFLLGLRPIWRSIRSHYVKHIRLINTQ